MSALYKCDRCEKTEEAAQPGRYTTIPDRWWWREKTGVKAQMHACSDACLTVLVEAGWSGWKRISRSPQVAQPRKTPAECKACLRMKNGGPCLFHRVRTTRGNA
jgi:hypothetical protein